MTNHDQQPGSATSATPHETKCPKCGANTRLDTGVCVSCLLREGLEADGNVSQAFYETVLEEVNAPYKPWFLGNYEILEQIGCGGMGVIYRARQRHSQRIVAVKRVLSYRADSHSALQRFRREAQAVASLDHPNILPIYEVSESEDGLPFFSMKFAEEGSLQENAPSLLDQPRKCVQLMAKVARAVDYAHSRGVLHRDIKPGNILLNDRGEPLVSDFGLAKLLDGNNDLTRSLTTFGTAGFIAPEQAGHAAVDFTPAADVYSLGAVLFNLLSGRPPFLGSNPVSVIRQASEAQAPKLRSLVTSLDRDLETICARCLERDPKARYQSAGDLATDLECWLEGRPIVARPVSVPARMWRWSRRNPKLVGATTAGLLLGASAVWLSRGELLRPSQFNPPDRSIAVLPFSDSSDTKDQGNLSDGISEEILDTLGRVDGLRVTGRTSSFSLKGKNTKEIGEKLNVGNVLEGTLHRQGNRVRVTAELVDTRNGFRVWTETYDRELDAAFALQDEIARSIVDRLKIKLAVEPSREQPVNAVNGGDLQERLTNLSRPPRGTSGAGFGVPVQNSPNLLTLPDYTPPGHSALDGSDSQVTAAPPPTEITSSIRDPVLEPSLQKNKITAEMIAAPPPPGSTTVSVRDRPLEAALPTNRITSGATAGPSAKGASTTVREFEGGVRTSKSTGDGSASIQGVVKDVKGDPIKGADIRIESRDGKQLIRTVKTDPKGRYISHGLQPGGYRVTLLVNGTVKASISDTQTKTNEPTQLNFDFKRTSQAVSNVKGRKHMVWVPNRTGSHIGGNWVEVDAEGTPHFDSNVQTYSVRR